MTCGFISVRSLGGKGGQPHRLFSQPRQGSGAKSALYNDLIGRGVGSTMNFHTSPHFKGNPSHAYVRLSPINSVIH